MARGTPKVLRGNSIIVIETEVNEAHRITIPKNIWALLDIHQPIRVTIERIGGKKT